MHDIYVKRASAAEFFRVSAGSEIRILKAQKNDDYRKDLTADKGNRDPLFVTVELEAAPAKQTAKRIHRTGARKRRLKICFSNLLMNMPVIV